MGQPEDQRKSPGNLSPGMTTVAFDPIVPPLRIPVPAGKDDDSSNGKWLLAFADEESWRRGWQTCRSKLYTQCETGARMGCSVSAAKLCRQPWWKSALVFLKATKVEQGERERCEEREMAACLAGAKDGCSKFAANTCDAVYADVRIAETHVGIDRRFSGPPRRKRLQKDFEKMQSRSAAFEGRILDAEDADGQLDGAGTGGSSNMEAKSPVSEQVWTSTNFRGRRLMTMEVVDKSRDGLAWSESAADGNTSGPKDSPMDEWEGGLIRPKFDSKAGKASQRDKKERPDVGQASIWQIFEDRVKGFFNNVRL